MPARHQCRDRPVEGAAGVVQAATAARAGRFWLPTVVAHELFYGAYRSQRQAHNLAVVEALQFEVLELDTEDARQAGEIRAVLATTGRSIGPCDVLIAGQARARQLTLITRNTSEFRRVAGLEVEDWET